MTQNKQVYIELYNYTQVWRDLPQADRMEFTNAVGAAVNSMAENGADVLGFGFNDKATDRRAPYDFFCLYALPDTHFAKAFEQEVEASGWYGFFEQKNVSGLLQSPQTLLAQNAGLAMPDQKTAQST
ncbi:MAG: DUF6616 family protein [Sneathiella sp.]